MKINFSFFIFVICCFSYANSQSISDKQIFQDRSKIANQMLDGAFKKALDLTKALKKKILASPKSKSNLADVHCDLILALVASYHSKMISKEVLDTELKALVGSKISIFTESIITDCNYDCCQFGDGENEFIKKVDSDFTKDGDLQYYIKVDDRLVCDKNELAGKKMIFDNATVQSFELLSDPFPIVIIRIFAKDANTYTTGKVVSPY